MQMLLTDKEIRTNFAVTKMSIIITKQL